MMKSNDMVLRGHNWMNNFCPQCRHYYTDKSFCYCKIPAFSLEVVKKAISEGDRSLGFSNWTSFLHLSNAPYCLACFEPTPSYSINGLLKDEEAKLNVLYSAEVYPVIGGPEAPLVTTEDWQRACWVAVQALENAVQREPGEFLWHYSLGAKYFPLGRFADAVIANSHALALHPDDPRVHYNMATYFNILTRAAYCGPAFRSKVEKIKIMQEQVKSDWRTYADMLPFNPDQAAYELQKLNMTWEYAAVEAVKHFERAKALGLPSSEVEHIDNLIKAMRKEFRKLGGRHLIG